MERVQKEFDREHREEYELPASEEIDREIDGIVKAAFRENPPVFSYMRELCRRVGFRFLLHDMSYIFVLVVMLYSILFITVIFEGGELTLKLSVSVMSVTPLVFWLPMVLFVRNEKDKRFYDLQMTYKYTFRHILALKLIFVSIITVVVNLLWCILLMKKMDFGEVIHLFFIAVTALGIYSLCFMWLMTRQRERFASVAQLVLLFGWLLVNLVLYNMFPSLYRMLTVQFPIVYHIGAWVLLGIAGSRCLANYFEMSRRGFVSC